MNNKKCVVCGTIPESNDPCILLHHGITEHTATPLRDMVGPALQQGLNTSDIICMRCLDLFNEKDRLQKLTTDMDSHIQTKIQETSRKEVDRKEDASGSINIVVGSTREKQGIKDQLESQYRNMRVALSSSDTIQTSQEKNGEALTSASKRRRGRPPKATQWVAKRREPPPLMVNHREKRKRSAKFSTFLEVLKGEKEFYIEDEGDEPRGKKRNRGKRKRTLEPGPDIVQVEQSREEGLERTCIIQVTDMELSQREKERLDLDEVVQEILGIGVDSTSSLIPSIDSLGCSNRDGQEEVEEEEEEDLISAINKMSAEEEEGSSRDAEEMKAGPHIKLEPTEEKELQQTQQQEQDDPSNVWPQIKREPGCSVTPFIEVTEIKEDLAAGIPSVEVTLSHDGSDTLHATISDSAALSQASPSDAAETLEADIKNEESNRPAVGVKKYRCKLCACTFLGREDARQHAQECHGGNLSLTGSKNEDSFKCSDCDRCFPTARGRDRHHLHMHLKHQPAQCPECPSTFNSFRPLERHLRNHHDKDPSLYCELCEMEFVLGTSLEHHKEIVHPNVPSKTKVVRTTNNQRAREPEKQNRLITCPLCKEEVVGARAFRLHHQKMHNGCEYNCTYCNYKSACFSSINRHMVRVHKAFDMKLYSCQSCSARYSVPRDLEEHYLCVHNVEATLLCQHCGEKFACVDMLRFHRNSHRAFSCKLCHLGFMKEEALEYHVKTVHHCDPVGGTERTRTQLKSKDVSAGTKSDKKDGNNEKDVSIPKVLVIATDGSVQVKEEKEESAEPTNDVTLHLQQTREGGLEEMDMLNPLKGQRVKDLPKKMSCPICNKVLTTKFLRTHMLSHKGNLPHKCRLCDKAYAQGTLLRKHMKNRHYEEFLKLGNKNPKKQKVACDFCEEIFNDIYSLEEHLWMHMDEKAFECTDCKIKFGMESNLREHYKSHYFKEAKPCPVCQREFKSIGFYNDHVEKCQKRWKCEQCGLECDTQEYYRKHHRSEHGGENVVRYHCSLCEKSFVERHRYDDHMITHSSEKAFTCHICLKQFKRQRPLNDHLVRTHSNGLFMCSYCSKTFQKQQDLDAHKLKHKREFPCASCSHVYSSNEALLNHLMVHHSESSHSCHMCAEPFTKQIQLKNHLVTHSTSTPHICQVDRCHKMFRSEGLLRNHVARRHHGLHYDCPVCDRKFSLESDQIRHVATHSNGSSMTCEECGRNFRSEALLERHLVTHTQEKPYECGVCQHATSTRHQIMRHIQSEHDLPDVSSHVIVNRWRCSMCGKMFVVRNSIMRHLLDHATHGVEAQGHAVKTRLSPSSSLELSLPSGSVDPATATASFLEQVSSLSWQDLTRLLRFHVMGDNENDKGEEATINTDVWQCPGCLHATQTEDDMRDHLLGSSECQEAVILQLAGGLATTEDTEDENSAEEQLIEGEGNGTVLQLASTDGGLQYVIMREDEDTSPQRFSEGTKEIQSEGEEGEMQVLVSMDDSLQQLLHQEPTSPNIQIIVEDSAPLKHFLTENAEEAVNPTANTSQNDSSQDSLPADATLLNGSEVLLQTVDGRLVLQQTVGGVTQYQLVEGVPTTAIEDTAPTLIPDHSSTLDEEFILSN
ncbi:zinc finger protein 729-like [Scylla paramamosain]|uniref:zinc finger protein 729-like n=1 Tax=Scylla paramamosain TaxID=85552 RepID=UPI003082BC41